MASRVLKTDGHLTRRALQAITWSAEYVAAHVLEHAFQSALNQHVLLYYHACVQIEGDMGKDLEDQEQCELMDALVTNRVIGAPLRQYRLPYEQGAMWSAWKARSTLSDPIRRMLKEAGLDAPFTDRRR